MSESMVNLAELTDSVRRVTDSMGLAVSEQEAWPQVIELGWLLANVPEELDGLGMGLPAVCAIQQELGRSLMAVPFAAATLAVEAVCNSALEDRAGWVERLAMGEAFVTAPLIPAAVAMTADGNLNGRLSAVPSADRASHVLVCTNACVALLPGDALQITQQATWDETRRLFDVALPDEGIKPEQLLATGDAAAALSRRLAAQLDFALAADAVGGAAMLLEQTVEYLQTRKQFGRPLALFQALKHRCADLKAGVTAAEALLFDSLRRATGEADCAALAMGAKAFACGAYAQVAEEAIQLHGGIGVTVEMPCHLFLKRAQLNEQLGWQSGQYELAIADYFLNT